MSAEPVLPASTRAGSPPANGLRTDASRHWRIADLASLADERYRYEIGDGVLEMTPPPALRHSLVVSRLTRILVPQLPREMLCIAEFGLGIGASFRLPDLGIMFAASDPDAASAPPGDVLLVAEVISPASRDIDRFVKPQEYARSGIPVYLLLDPAAARITAHVLDPGATTYRVVAVRGQGEVLELNEPVPLVIDVGEVFG